MTSTPSIPMSEFLDKYPQALRNWIEQDLGWKVEEISDILIEPVTYYVSVSRNFNDGHETQGQYFTPLASGEWEKKENRREALSEAGYSLLKPGVRNWIEQDLQWKREEIISYHIKYELLEDGHITDENKKQWKRWKHGKNVEVTITRMTQEKQFARFIRMDDGDWELKKVDNT